MARFFFNLHGAEELPDAEGVELPNLAAVRRRAIDEARALLSADVLTGEIRIDRHFAVTDEGGSIVLILMFADALTVRESA
jgi:hypothetical protein